MGAPRAKRDLQSREESIRSRGSDPHSNPCAVRKSIHPALRNGIARKDLRHSQGISRDELQTVNSPYNGPLPENRWWIAEQRVADRAVVCRCLAIDVVKRQLAPIADERWTLHADQLNNTEQ